MKILNTVHYEVYSEQHRAFWQLQRQFIRTRKLSYSGAQRMIRSGNGFMPHCCGKPIWHQPEYPDAAIAIVYRYQYPYTPNPLA